MASSSESGSIAWSKKPRPFFSNVIVEVEKADLATARGFVLVRVRDIGVSVLVGRPGALVRPAGDDVAKALFAPLASWPDVRGLDMCCRRSMLIVELERRSFWSLRLQVTRLYLPEYCSAAVLKCRRNTRRIERGRTE